MRFGDRRESLITDAPALANVSGSDGANAQLVVFSGHTMQDTQFDSTAELAVIVMRPSGIGLRVISKSRRVQKSGDSLLER